METISFLLILLSFVLVVSKKYYPALVLICFTLLFLCFSYFIHPIDQANINL